jgi:hypothetical protein
MRPNYELGVMSRPATPHEERLVLAIHEAGHLVLTHYSTYFGLRDPALEIPTGASFAALAGATRVRDTAAQEHHQPSAREFVKIAFAGKAAEEEFVRLQSAGSSRLIPNPDGANTDLANAYKTLLAMDMLHEKEQLWIEAIALVQREWASILAVAALILDHPGPIVSRAEILAVLPQQHDG